MKVSFVGVQGYGTFTVIAVDSPMLAQGTCSGETFYKAVFNRFGSEIVIP